MTADAVHQVLTNPFLAVAVWAFALAQPFVAWVPAALLSPGTSRWGRGAMVVGRSTLVLLVLLVLVRAAELMSGAMSGGPLGWMNAVATPTGGWLPREAVLLLALLYSLMFVPVCAIGALVWRAPDDTSPYRIPVSKASTTALVAAAVIAPVASYGPYGVASSTPAFLDVAAALPVTCMALAVWTRAYGVAVQEQQQVEAGSEEASTATADVQAIWRQIGALGTAQRPLFAMRGSSALEGGGQGQAAWAFAGVHGPSPSALDQISGLCSTPGQGWIVGDLPDPTEGYFLTAFLVCAIREIGLPCLVVAKDTTALRDSVRAAIQRSGSWSCGLLVAGEGELRKAFAGQRLPAAAILSVPDLSSAGIRTLSGGGGGNGGLWCRSVALVIVAGIDRGDPLEVTHRYFTLRRLGLALAAAGAQWSVVATGFGGTGSQTLARQVFPSIQFKAVPFGARVSAPVRIWQADSRFCEQRDPPWVTRAVAPVATAGVRISVGDPGGAFDRSAVEVWGGDVRLVRDTVLDGAASVSKLNDAWMVASCLSIPNLVPNPDGHPHEALWQIDQNPVTRFLLAGNGLAHLRTHGLLRPPRPLVGRDNRSLALGHLQAALREGEQDVESLAGLFGRSLVDQVLGKDFVPDRWVVRSLPKGDGLIRTGVVPVRTGRPTNPLRTTVTEDVVQVVDQHGGRVLAEVDRLVAPTRYYPHRVFAVGEKRYWVPPHSFDAQRSQINVEQASEHTLTMPVIDFEVDSPVLVQTPQEYRKDRLVFSVATFEATVHERVTGAARASGDRVTYPPVTARYRSRVRAVFFTKESTKEARYHLARSVDGVLVAHLFARDEDIEVVDMGAEFHPGTRGGILAIDRYVSGMGASESLTIDVVTDVLRWTKAILKSCSCPYGCERCTPPEVCEVGGDKPGVLALLSG